MADMSVINGCVSGIPSFFSISTLSDPLYAVVLAVYPATLRFYGFAEVRLASNNSCIDCQSQRQVAQHRIVYHPVQAKTMSYVCTGQTSSASLSDRGSRDDLASR